MQNFSFKNEFHMHENDLVQKKKRGKRQLGKINYAHVKICTSFKSTRTLTTIPTKRFEKGWAWLATLSSPRHWMLQRANVPTTDKLYTITLSPILRVQSTEMHIYVKYRIVHYKICEGYVCLLTTLKISQRFAEVLRVGIILTTQKIIENNSLLR